MNPPPEIVKSIPLVALRPPEHVRFQPPIHLVAVPIPVGPRIHVSTIAVPLNHPLLADTVVHPIPAQMSSSSTILAVARPPLGPMRLVPVVPDSKPSNGVSSSILSAALPLADSTSPEVSAPPAKSPGHTFARAQQIPQRAEVIPPRPPAPTLTVVGPSRFPVRPVVPMAGAKPTARPLPRVQPPSPSPSPTINNLQRSDPSSLSQPLNLESVAANRFVLPQSLSFLNHSGSSSTYGYRSHQSNRYPDPPLSPLLTPTTDTKISEADWSWFDKPLKVEVVVTEVVPDVEYKQEVKSKSAGMGVDGGVLETRAVEMKQDGIGTKVVEEEKDLEMAVEVEAIEVREVSRSDTGPGLIIPSCVHEILRVISPTRASDSEPALVMSSVDMITDTSATTHGRDEPLPHPDLAIEMKMDIDRVSASALLLSLVEAPSEMSELEDAVSEAMPGATSGLAAASVATEDIEWDKFMVEEVDGDRDDGPDHAGASMKPDTESQSKQNLEPAVQPRHQLVPVLTERENPPPLIRTPEATIGPEQINLDGIIDSMEPTQMASVEEEFQVAYAVGEQVSSGKSMEQDGSELDRTSDMLVDESLPAAKSTSGIGYDMVPQQQDVCINGTDGNHTPNVESGSAEEEMASSEAFEIDRRPASTGSKEINTARSVPLAIPSMQEVAISVVMRADSMTQVENIPAHPTLDLAYSNPDEILGRSGQGEKYADADVASGGTHSKMGDLLTDGGTTSEAELRLSQPAPKPAVCETAFAAELPLPDEMVTEDSSLENSEATSGLHDVQRELDNSSQMEEVTPVGSGDVVLVPPSEHPSRESSPKCALGFLAEMELRDDSGGNQVIPVVADDISIKVREQLSNSSTRQGPGTVGMKNASSLGIDGTATPIATVLKSSPIEALLSVKPRSASSAAGHVQPRSDGPSAEPSSCSRRRSFDLATILNLRNELPQMETAFKCTDLSIRLDSVSEAAEDGIVSGSPGRCHQTSRTIYSAGVASPPLLNPSHPTNEMESRTSHAPARHHATASPRHRQPWHAKFDMAPPADTITPSQDLAYGRRMDIVPLIAPDLWSPFQCTSEAQKDTRESTKPGAPHSSDRQQVHGASHFSYMHQPLQVQAPVAKSLESPRTDALSMVDGTEVPQVEDAPLDSRITKDEPALVEPSIGRTLGTEPQVSNSKQDTVRFSGRSESQAETPAERTRGRSRRTEVSRLTYFAKAYGALGYDSLGNDVIPTWTRKRKFALCEDDDVGQGGSTKAIPPKTTDLPVHDPVVSEHPKQEKKLQTGRPKGKQQVFSSSVKARGKKQRDETEGKGGEGKRESARTPLAGNRNVRWTEAERQKIASIVSRLIQTHVKISWVEVAEQMPGRTPRASLIDTVGG